MGDSIAERFVDSVDGVRIAVYEQGNPDGPTVVMVHGWPDSHVLWDGVVPLLADRFRIIRYDNRGVGKSSVPKPVSAYTMAKLADDSRRGDRELSPGEPVHLLGSRLGFGGHVGVPAQAGGQRPSRVVHVGVGTRHRPLGGYIFDSLKRPYRPVQFLRALGQSAPDDLHGIRSRCRCSLPRCSGPWRGRGEIDCSPTGSPRSSATAVKPRSPASSTP